MSKLEIAAMLWIFVGGGLGVFDMARGILCPPLDKDGNPKGVQYLLLGVGMIVFSFFMMKGCLFIHDSLVGLSSSS